jgi:hypothetical protein
MTFRKTTAPSALADLPGAVVFSLPWEGQIHDDLGSRSSIAVIGNNERQHCSDFCGCGEPVGNKHEREAGGGVDDRGQDGVGRVSGDSAGCVAVGGQVIHRLLRDGSFFTYGIQNSDLGGGEMTPEFKTWLRMHCVCFPTVGDHFKRLKEEDRDMLEGQWARSLAHVKIPVLERTTRILMEHSSKFRIMFDQHIGKILEISGSLQERGQNWKNENIWKKQAPLSECTKECNYWTRLYMAGGVDRTKWIEALIDASVKFQDEGWYKTASSMEERLEGVKQTQTVVTMAG